MRYFFAAATNEQRPDRNLLLHEFEHDSSRKNKKERTRQNNCINLSNGDFYSGSEKKVNRNSFLGGGGGLELHLCYLKRTLFGMHSANLDRFANFGLLLLETMDPFQVSK